MTRVKLTVCNRCGHTENEDEFAGMDVTIFDQGGVGTEEDQFTLCDPCTDQLRKWIVTKPSAATPGRASGGYARATKLTRVERSAIAKKAAKARWESSHDSAPAQTDGPQA